MAYEKVPERIKESLHRYVIYGIMPGGFLSAVLENNLMAAVHLASGDCREGFFEIASYIWNELPLVCHGSADKVRAWMQSKEPKCTCGPDSDSTENLKCPVHGIM